MAIDIQEIIAKEAEGIVKALGMPTPRTTSFDKEMKKKKKKRKIFETRVFLIVSDASAISYSQFISDIMSGSSGRELVREVENWTKEGELIRVVDTVRETDD